MLATVGSAIPVLGQLGAGLVGGFVAGYLAGGGVLVVGLVLTALFGLDSALAGTVGAAVRD